METNGLITDNNICIFPVVQTGVHQINFSTLNTSLNSLGVNLNQINHDQFQIFGKEKELF